MLIDWFTVGAQTLNFVILVWLMKRYLYKPVLDAIDAREQRIASELRPFRTASFKGAREVVELAAGECERRGLQVGDRISWKQADETSSTNK